MRYGSRYDFLNTHLCTNDDSLSVSDTGETLSSLNLNWDSINCVTKIASKSDTNDDVTASVSCPSGYTLTGCTGHTCWQNFDGW